MSAKQPEDLVLEPRENNVYVKLDPPPESSGLIKLTEDVSTLTRIATVLACGKKCEWYKVGDRVLISAGGAGDSLYLWQYGIRNDDYRIIAEHHILGKVIGE